MHEAIMGTSKTKYGVKGRGDLKLIISFYLVYILRY
jgi:hypothetical protein